MHLVIDIGNTRVKAAIFSGKELLHFYAFPSQEEMLAAGLIRKHSLTHGIIGSVVNGIEDFVVGLREEVPVLLYDAGTPVPLKNKYRSAHTLGSDRLAAAVGGYALAAGQDLLVIDAGTCIKYNFVNA